MERLREVLGMTYSCCALMPKRFLLPATGEAHSGGVNGWIFCEQSLEIGYEGVLLFDGVEPICYTTELWIDFVGRE